jgi:hypothetical protein
LSQELSGSSAQSYTIHLEVDETCSRLETQGVDVVSFIQLMDDLWFNGRRGAWSTEKKARKESKGEVEAVGGWRDDLTAARLRLVPFLETLRAYLFADFVKSIVMIGNFTAFMLYGYQINSRVLDAANFAFVVFWSLEVLTRMGVNPEGPKGFWNIPQDFFAQAENRYDFTVGFLPLLAFLIDRAAYRSFHLDFWQEGGHADLSRAILVIPLMRVFTLITLVKYNFLGILNTMSVLVDQLATCCLISYAFAAAGCMLFSGRLVSPSLQVMTSSVQIPLVELYPMQSICVMICMKVAYRLS